MPTPTMPMGTPQQLYYGGWMPQTASSQGPMLGQPMASSQKPWEQDSESDSSDFEPSQKSRKVAASKKSSSAAGTSEKTGSWASQERSQSRVGNHCEARGHLSGYYSERTERV
ncbi:uncharacterized protein LOC113214761 [Frankliniella occidentalis]|uniref:Uncharacterized protein LOC113214761 n=1 Tax=Frankliniella occidentalis TaxID=133901 RepID=A0A9C6XU26_FRAOC|nr:uncharacterized protein LOC113214761 [Frankliniella occidentalis]